MSVGCIEYKNVVRSTDYPKMFERIKYKGEWKDCNIFHTIDQAGNGCNCPFVACTGARECTAGGFRCYFTNENVSNEDVKDGECKCRYIG
ncbi:hypothetical protein QZH41_002330 [Actinostola sp. cb2023]|nr:hypothetical protein QZH41_002330 [Actinostola sp. cb2023]